MVIEGFNAFNTNKGLVVETRQKDDEVWKTCKDIGDVNSSPLNFTCDSPTNARYIKIGSAAKCYIDLYEVEVYARVPV